MQNSLSSTKDSLAPIREFFDKEGHIKKKGQQLCGQEISAYFFHVKHPDVKAGPVDRTEIYYAVKDFEDANNIKNRVIDEHGIYEDKDFLYGGYDNYVAMSHEQELSSYIKPGAKADYSQLAEIQYAKTNGLSEEQLNMLIGDSKRNASNMREIRSGFEKGLSTEQVATFSEMKDSFAQEDISEMLVKGGSLEQAQVFNKDSDSALTHIVITAYKKGMSADVAKAVVQNYEKLIALTPESSILYDHRASITEAFTIEASNGTSGKAITKMTDEYIKTNPVHDISGDSISAYLDENRRHVEVQQTNDTVKRMPRVPIKLPYDTECVGNEYGPKY